MTHFVISVNVMVMQMTRKITQKNFHVHLPEVCIEGLQKKNSERRQLCCL